MLETSEERVKLLKAGFTCKEIEQLYVKNNHLKIIRLSILKELAGSCHPENKTTGIKCKLEAGYTAELCTELV